MLTVDQIIAQASREATAKELTDSGFSIVVPVWLKNMKTSTVEDVNKFIKKFFTAYRNRPSQRTTGKMTTVSDPLTDVLIAGRISKFDADTIKLIRFGHRLSMGTENIIGLILEEYIHTKVISLGWATCWGSCIKAVDLCSMAGDLIQIKNRDNTENSSSDKIREGTTIKKWYRMQSKTGKTEWEKLNEMLHLPPNNQLSEEDFENFTKILVQKNPACLYVDPDDYAEIEKILENQ